MAMSGNDWFYDVPHARVRAHIYDQVPQIPQASLAYAKHITNIYSVTDNMSEDFGWVLCQGSAPNRPPERPVD